jgi:hypothetical protein
MIEPGPAHRRPGDAAPAGAARLAPLRVLALGAALGLLLSACATLPARPLTAAAAVPGFVVGEDTFAFPNEIRSRNPDRPGLYANYCFVLARGVRQFHDFARFEPGRPRLDRTAYRARVRLVVAHHPWDAPLPADDRVVIPGYRNLHEFSRDQEATVKDALGPRFWTLVNWTNWRVVLPVSGGHQAHVAEEIAAELRAGRLAQLLVTNWPTPELNHTVVAYAYQATDAAIDFSVYDPNEPAAPGVLTFDRQAQRFWATRIYDTRPGRIRAFRMYYSRWL